MKGVLVKVVTAGVTSVAVGATETLGQRVVLAQPTDGPRLEPGSLVRVRKFLLRRPLVHEWEWEDPVLAEAAAARAEAAKGALQARVADQVRRFEEALAVSEPPAGTESWQIMLEQFLALIPERSPEASTGSWERKIRDALDRWVAWAATRPDLRRRFDSILGAKYPAGVVYMGFVISEWSPPKERGQFDPLCEPPVPPALRQHFIAIRSSDERFDAWQRVGVQPSPGWAEDWSQRLPSSFPAQRYFGLLECEHTGVRLCADVESTEEEIVLLDPESGNAPETVGDFRALVDWVAQRLDPDETELLARLMP
jgi:hypothetical protein